MQQRRLGTGGLPVGSIGLGCMGMSWAYGEPERNDAESVRVLQRALELGVTLIDTADVYGPFHNEELVGRALASYRDSVTLATKVGLVLRDGEVVRDGRPEYVREACDGSLRRLGVDRIDLYQLHRVDPKVPVEETWGAMADLVRAGKVRALGISEATLPDLKRVMHVFPVTSVQSELSLWTRESMADILPWCVSHGVGFIPYAPLGRGFLTGRYATANFATGDFRSRNPRFTPRAIAANLAIVDVVKAVARRHGATPAQVAIAWVLAQGDQVVPIPGTKKLRYLEENVKAAYLELTPADFAELDALPEPVGDRY